MLAAALLGFPPNKQHIACDRKIVCHLVVIRFLIIVHNLIPQRESL